MHIYDGLVGHIRACGVMLGRTVAALALLLLVTPTPPYRVEARTKAMFSFADMVQDRVLATTRLPCDNSHRIRPTLGQVVIWLLMIAHRLPFICIIVFALVFVAYSSAAPCRRYPVAGSAHCLERGCGQRHQHHRAHAA